jgi:hypothetical protein
MSTRCAPPASVIVRLLPFARARPPLKVITPFVRVTAWLLPPTVALAVLALDTTPCEAKTIYQALRLTTIRR